MVRTIPRTLMVMLILRVLYSINKVYRSNIKIKPVPVCLSQLFRLTYLQFMQKEYSKTKIEQFVIDRVVEIRKVKGFSQLDLSTKMGLSPGFISDVESSKRRAKYNLNHLNKLVKVLGCNFNDFFPATAFDEGESQDKS